MTARAEKLASSRSRSRYAPVLVAAPLSMWTAGLLCDIATRLVGDGSVAVLDLAYRLLGIGIVVAIALALWSAIDLRAIRNDTREADVALTHTALLLGATLLAIGSLFWRELVPFETQAAAGPAVLALLAVALLGGALSYNARVKNSVAS